MTSFQKVLASLIQLLSNSAGRDKMCRIVQYYCKFLLTRYADKYQIMIAERNELRQKMGKSESLMGAMSMTRKVLRFGPSINVVKNCIGLITQLLEGKHTEKQHIVCLRILSCIFLEMFLVCDHYTWLYKVNLVKNNELNLRCQYLGALGWMLDCITNLIKNFMLFQQLDKEERKSKTKALVIDTARVAADLPIAYSFTFPGTVDGKIVGLLGTFTSAVSIYQMWPQI